ncbi:alpha/beta fold hydrolase [Propionivibrio sp.]|uniref:alpha/beta fold hydrolase n=1 Tax=Propionivibrio sp. TaxID=2212460 RepID=UPI003BF2AF6E
MTKKTANWFVILLLFFVLSGRSYANNPDSAKSCHITTQEVAVDGGVIHYRSAGTGPHILLLHGLFAQKEQWDSIMCLLSASGFAAIAPDLPGYGQSVAFPIADYKLENQVVLLHQFMNILGITSFNLAGSSMGGAIATLYVERHPRQIRSLAFIGSPLGVTEWGKSVKEAIYRGVNPFIPIDIPQLDNEMSLLFVNPPTLPESLKESLVKDYVERNRHYQQIWNIVNLYDTALSDHPIFEVPTLIIWGKEDKIFAIEGADRLRNRFSRVKLVKLPKAGHLPLLENANETATIYLRFLKHEANRRSRISFPTP